MNNIEREIAREIEKEGIATLGDDMFTSSVEWTHDDVVWIKSRPGGESSKYTPTFESYVEIWTRNPIQSQAYNRIKAIYDLFQRKGNYPTDNYYVYFTEAVSTPVNEQVDENRRQLYSLTLRCKYREIIS